MSAPETTAPYWSREAADVGASLGSGPNGLTAARAAERLAVVGPNTVEDAQCLGPLRLLWKQLGSPLVLILVSPPALNKDLPVSRSVAMSADGEIVAIPCLGGLHHHYERRAA